MQVYTVWATDLCVQVKFILAVVHGELIVNGRKRKEIEGDMERMNFDRMPKNDLRAKPGAAAPEAEEDADAAAQGLSYEYLLSMAISSLTEEKVSIFPQCWLVI